MKPISIILGALVFIVIASVVIFAGLVAIFRTGDDAADAADVDRVEVEVVEEDDSEEVDEPNEPDDQDDDADPSSDSDDSGSTDGDSVFGAEPVQEDVSEIQVANGSVDEFEGEIGPNGFDVFQLDLEQGTEVIVSVQANNGEFDTLLRAVGPSGEQVAGNDDADASAGLFSIFDSQVVFVADAGGTYELEVLSYDASMGGSYVLTVDRTGEGFVPEDVEFAPALEPGSGGLEDSVVLTTGPNAVETLLGNLEDPTAFDSFSFELEAGETVTISAEGDPTGALDAFMTLANEAGAIVAINDDARAQGVVGQTTDSYLEVRVVEAGTYAVEVASFAAQSSGEYTLTIARTESDGGGAPPVDELRELDSSLFIDPGETLTVEGTVEFEALYDLVLDAGDRVTITVESADPATFDPAVFLSFGAFDIGANDDAADPSTVADQFDSRIELTTANTGIHTIAILGFAGSSGDFTMTVERN